MELTLEISCCKFPSHTEIEGFWNDNKNALITLLTQVHLGQSHLQSYLLASWTILFSQFTVDVVCVVVIIVCVALLLLLMCVVVLYVLC